MCRAATSGNPIDMVTSLICSCCPDYMFVFSLSFSATVVFFSFSLIKGVNDLLSRQGFKLQLGQLHQVLFTCAECMSALDQISLLLGSLHSQKSCSYRIVRSEYFEHCQELLTPLHANIMQRLAGVKFVTLSPLVSLKHAGNLYVFLSHSTI